MSEEIKYKGRIFEVVQKRVVIDGEEKVFELARRSPGVRLIIVTPDNQLLLTKEHRKELNAWDYRLPGGKVFDTLDEYGQFAGDVLSKAEEAARKEAEEEVGIKVEEVKFFNKSVAGATVEWDLYYFIVSKYGEVKQKLEAGENIEIVKVDFEEAKQMCLDGRISEDRSVGVLLRFLLK